MASPTSRTGPVGPDTLITVKVICDGQTRRFKLALRDLGAHVLPQTLRVLLTIPSNVEVKFDRFSDSAASYITLDSNNPAVYKQLYRAAKAKLKLRLRVTIIRPGKKDTQPINIMDDQSSKAELDKVSAVSAHLEPRQSYLETVLSQPLPANISSSSFKPFQETTRRTQPTCAIPGAFYSGDSYVDPPPRPAPRSSHLSQPTIPSFHDFSAGTFSIDCNYCGKSIPNEHYHCSICEKGDFDLCQACVDAGVTCDGIDHWLLKRFIRNGIVVNSVTETCPPRKTEEVKVKSENPTEHEVVERTCNNCISQLPATAFVTCQACPDFDLCLDCFRDDKHGHSVAHAFDPVDKRANMVTNTIKLLCTPGRGMIHHATCDNCNKQIVGVRHKCLSCPDFDYCSKCAKDGSKTHPVHRFAALYEPLGYSHTRKEVHRGIYCDGPLCMSQSRKTYIGGDRYKCAVCHDTDFCDNCEALPTGVHNKTHPLIKIRVPIRHVSIHTVQENDDGVEVGQMGDRPMVQHAATETTRTTSTNAATQVQTVAEVKPAGNVTPVSAPKTWRDMDKSSDLEAWYESDSTPDGSSFAPNRLVSQSWTLRNPGPQPWPVGCAVHYIGGDDMRNLDALRPSSSSTMIVANRSNVLDYSLQPGKTAVFSVLLKSPAREGRAISYWRLKTPEGLPFGHKLWLDVNVAPAVVELPVRSALSSPSKQPSVSEESEAEMVEKPEESSTMIFPKLDKESPMSSTHDISETTAPVVEPTVTNDDQELLEEVESLELEDESDEDDFLTDEEYDILDASDEEYLMEAQQAVSKK